VVVEDIGVSEHSRPHPLMAGLPRFLTDRADGLVIEEKNDSARALPQHWKSVVIRYPLPSPDPRHQAVLRAHGAVVSCVQIGWISLGCQVLSKKDGSGL
jgi:hypothetical protein